MTKLRRPTPKQYDQDLINQAIAYCTPFRPCIACGWPVMQGDKCRLCGEELPRVIAERDRFLSALENITVAETLEEAVGLAGGALNE